MWLHLHYQRQTQNGVSDPRHGMHGGLEGYQLTKEAINRRTMRTENQRGKQDHLDG